LNPGKARADGLRPQRILIIILNQVGRGTFGRASYFARMLAQRGHQVTLMATSPTARLRLRERAMDGVRLVETPDLLFGSLRSGWDLYNALRRIQWLHGQEFDLVHAVESRPVVLLPALYAQRRGARLIMDWCDWFGRGGSVEERPNRLVRALVRPIDTFFEERFRRRAEGTLVIAPHLRERAIALGVRPETIAFIRNGSNTAVQPADMVAARQELGLPLAAPLVGYLGAIYPRDAQLMAHALNEVGRCLPQARLVLIGYFNRNIEDMLYNPSAVIRTGPIPFRQLHLYVAACNACWLPLCDTGANRGRWPGKLNDYMAAGRPVVATPVGELATLVPQHGLGVLARDEPIDFAAQTVALLSDPERCERLGRSARRAAETVMSWERMTDELEAFYQRVLVGMAG